MKVYKWRQYSSEISVKLPRKILVSWIQLLQKEVDYWKMMAIEAQIFNKNKIPKELDDIPEDSESV